MTLQSLYAYGPESPVWRAVNDGVMGGISSGSAVPLEKGLIRFAGILSLVNKPSKPLPAKSPRFVCLCQDSNPPPTDAVCLRRLHSIPHRLCPWD